MNGWHEDDALIRWFCTDKGAFQRGKRKVVRLVPMIPIVSSNEERDALS